MENKSGRIICALVVFAFVHTTVRSHADYSLLFPYGTIHGDILGPPIDEGHWAIDLSMSIVIFDSSHYSIGITDNGLIDIGSENFTSYKNGYSFPNSNLPSVLFPFWADFNFIVGAGQLFFRESTSGVDLSYFSRIVKNGLRSNSRHTIEFSANHVLVITFSNGTYWGGSWVTPRNTLQVVIGTDGYRTFALYHYAELGWISSGPYARVGYASTDGNGFYEHPYSLTAKVRHLTDYSNVNTEGRIMFQINSHCNHSICNSDHGVCLESNMCLCEDGYGGITCDTEINECVSNPCIRGSCEDFIDYYICDCPTGYTGVNCESEINECSSDPCEHGDCENHIGNFWCDCEDGYEGIHCEQEINECISCPCRFGECEDLVAAYECHCEHGYSGEHCEHNIDDCLHVVCEHGVCVDDVTYHTCVCHPGFSGENCEFDLDECASDPCFHGTCLNGADRFVCECEPGYTGTLCEDNIDDCDPSHCIHGTCYDGIDSFTCRCEEGYTGVVCELHVLDCNVSSCADTGYCVDVIPGLVCHCLRGYTGRECEIDINECESMPCEHGGTCHDNEAMYRCECQPGFEGLHCEINIDECEDDPCIHGDCTDGIDRFACTCHEGYTGHVCEIDIDECASSSCVHGLCRDHVNGYTCGCFPGYSGQMCETDLDECHDDPCERGVCEDGVNGYFCDCPDLVSGHRCQIDTRHSFGSWGAWGTWSACNKLCDNGLQTRFRQCLRNPCLQSNSEVQLCNTFRCEGRMNEPESMAVTLDTSLSAIQVVENESVLKATVADGLNGYCAKHREICCGLVNIKDPIANRAFDVFSEHNVAISSGYPLAIDNKRIRVRLLVSTTAGALRRVCGGRLRRSAYIADSQTLYITPDILRESIDKNMDHLNEVNCCWSILSKEAANTVSYILMGTLIPLGVGLIILCIVLVISPDHICNSHRSRSEDSVMSGTVDTPRKPPSLYYHPRYPRGKQHPRYELNPLDKRY